jgi:hypothetical protein
MLTSVQVQRKGLDVLFLVSTTVGTLDAPAAKVADLLDGLDPADVVRVLAFVAMVALDRPTPERMQFLADLHEARVRAREVEALDESWGLEP